MILPEFQIALRKFFDFRRFRHGLNYIGALERGLALLLYGMVWHFPLCSNRFRDTATQKTSEPKDWKPAMADKTSDSDQPVVIKKYANRRLYNTSTSSYVTLDYLCQMVKDDIDFVVLDAKGNDITRSVLTQIIVEEEAKGENLLPLSFLRQLIGFYGDNVQRCCRITWSIPSTLSRRTRKKSRIICRTRSATCFRFGQLEQMGKQNVAMFEQAMRMFTPFDGGKATEQTKPVDPKSEQPEAVQSLQDQLNALQAQLNKMSGDG